MMEQQTTRLDEQVQLLALKRAKQLCRRLGIKFNDLNSREKLKQDAKKVICMIMKKDGYHLKHIGYALDMPESNISRAIKTGYGLSKYNGFFRKLLELASNGHFKTK
jgi:hypothetical protein